MALAQLIREFLLERGALAVGFATRESLAGGPPSAELSYRMPTARSAISFALPMDRDAVRLFLSKQDRVPHEHDNLDTNMRSKDLSWDLAKMLQREGHESKGCAANIKYRTEYPNWQLVMHPDLSHRYLAVRSGVGSYGWSGNVGVKGFGTAVILGSTLTEAELGPTAPIPEAESFCDGCKICVRSCAAEMMEEAKALETTLGGVTFRHSARRNIILCQYVCGGFTGLHRSKKWSTWSPGRLTVENPDDENAVLKAFLTSLGLYAKRPPMPGGYQHPALKAEKTYMTCGNCQIVCFGNKKETAKNLKLLQTSGCVVQEENGRLLALPPDEAEAYVNGLPPERKRLYT